jgi:hypothetical protein
MGIKNKETFKYHYNLELSGGRCACGPGSDGESVKKAGTVDFIDGLIRRYGIKSISDCPCGLFENWICLVDLSSVEYTGYDINDLAVERNRKNNPSRSFFEFDLVNEILPKADLIICRDCLFHLSNDFVQRALKNFRDSGSTYLLATEHNHLKKNFDLTKEELEREAGFRHINLEISPYNLGTPIEMHVETLWCQREGGYNRQMSLWKLN